VLTDHIPGITIGVTHIYEPKIRNRGKIMKITDEKRYSDQSRFTVSNEGSTACAVVMLPDENGKVIGSIVSFKTSLELRRQGFGEALVRDTTDELRRRGATSFEVWAETRVWNKVTEYHDKGHSPELFRKLGFTETGQKNKFGDREFILDLV
tara:strand:- start:504 stop:959 length:456 start_codon:yes stop_codon:yes gene_type:complete